MPLMTSRNLLLAGMLLIARSSAATHIVPEVDPARDLNPIVLTGGDLPSLLGEEPGRIVGFRYAAGWEQIPVQIDERKLDNLCRIRRCGGEALALVYVDPTLRTGPDDDAMFDDNDELVFMFRDMGRRSTQLDPPGIVSGTRVEIRTIASTLRAERYMYLFVSKGGHDPSAGRDYVTYDFVLFGNPEGPGPNPEDSFIFSDRVRHHFSDRWIHDATSITAGGVPGLDILDRDKFQFTPGNCGRTTDTFSAGGGAFIANVDGPVRAIRSVIGANSGTITQRDWICYDGRMDVRTFLRVHPIANTWFFYDFSPDALGMIYYDNMNIDGVVVDGTPDDLDTGILQWQFLTGLQGAVTIAWSLDTDIQNLNRWSHYFDNSNPAWNQCTGDPFAFAASGQATGTLPNTDPLRGEAFRFILDRVIYYDEPGMTLPEALRRVAAAGKPIEMVITSQE